MRCSHDTNGFYVKETFERELKKAGKPRTISANRVLVHFSKAPSATQKVDPAYTIRDLQRRNTISGDYVVLIGADGSVQEVRTFGAGTIPGDNDSLAEALRQWRFQPQTYKGKPVEVQTALTITSPPPAGEARAELEAKLSAANQRRQEARARRTAAQNRAFGQFLGMMRGASEQNARRYNAMTPEQQCKEDWRRWLAELESDRNSETAVPNSGFLIERMPDCAGPQKYTSDQQIWAWWKSRAADRKQRAQVRASRKPEENCRLDWEKFNLLALSMMFADRDDADKGSLAELARVPEAMPACDPPADFTFDPKIQEWVERRNANH